MKKLLTLTSILCAVATLTFVTGCASTGTTTAASPQKESLLQQAGFHTMAGRIEARLAGLKIELPKAAIPVANYVPVVTVGNLAFVSGQVTIWNGEFRYKGRLGQEFKIEDGQAAARLCALNVVAQLKNALGDLDRVKRCAKLTVFVNSANDFTDQPKVANGASDLMVEVFGDAGKHTRSAVGVNVLPLNVAVEVEGIFEFA